MEKIYKATLFFFFLTYQGNDLSTPPRVMLFLIWYFRCWTRKKVSHTPELFSYMCNCEFFQKFQEYGDFLKKRGGDGGSIAKQNANLNVTFPITFLAPQSYEEGL